MLTLLNQQQWICFQIGDWTYKALSFTSVKFTYHQYEKQDREPNMHGDSIVKVMHAASEYSQVTPHLECMLQRAGRLDMNQNQF